ncbi:unnamed protein product [Schistocephalus solidus]|uniref:Uncharacterized protein n=1 Tax=Schistocephalus solidus TaxID=70667 RepID=A0A183SAM9_SCHSO|nr:unnamed protein product [Schistocephalus solidus]
MPESGLESSLACSFSSRLKNKDPVTVLMDGNDVEGIENCEKAEHLGQFSASIFTRKPGRQFDHFNSAVINAGLLLEYILFPEPLVERELQNLKEVKSSGPKD